MGYKGYAASGVLTLCCAALPTVVTMVTIPPKIVPGFYHFVTARHCRVLQSAAVRACAQLQNPLNYATVTFTQQQIRPWK